jgi:Zn-finger nucleic acid-binding protein
VSLLPNRFKLSRGLINIDFFGHYFKSYSVPLKESQKSPIFNKITSLFLDLPLSLMYYYPLSLVQSAGPKSGPFDVKDKSFVLSLGSLIMDCPVCKNAMITLELQDVEIDLCTDCDGIWLDAGELEMLLGEPEKAEKLLDSFKIDRTSSEKPKKCPICLKKMKKIIVGASKPVLLIDKCSKGHGLWFDKGELNDIFERSQLDKDNKIQELLADMFGREQNKNNQ